jgi:hypothetical protein
VDAREGARESEVPAQELGRSSSYGGRGGPSDCGSAEIRRGGAVGRAQRARHQSLRGEPQVRQRAGAGQRSPDIIEAVAAVESGAATAAARGARDA